MAGHYDAKWVLAVCTTDSTHSFGIVHSLSLFTVANSFAIRDSGQGLPSRFLKDGAFDSFQPEILVCPKARAPRIKDRCDIDLSPGIETSPLRGRELEARIILGSQFIDICQTFVLALIN